MTAGKPLYGKEIGGKGGGGGLQKRGRENGKKAGGGPGNDQNGREALTGFKALQTLILQGFSANGPVSILEEGASKRSGKPEPIQSGRKKSELIGKNLYKIRK
jgi:hypothetical protein